MKIKKLHDWDLDFREAARLQQRLASRVKLCPLPRRVRCVAGADVAFGSNPQRVYASVVALSFPELEPLEVKSASAPLTFPYVPGLLTFREGPALLEAFARTEILPDVVIFDGQGLAHPRRLGLACHIGLWLDIPSVGCAKSRLTGTHEPPGAKKGNRKPLMDGSEQIGTVLRTKASVKPVFVSPGHLSDFESACGLVLECCTRYRLPEPTRQAHMAVDRAKKGPG